MTHIPLKKQSSQTNFNSIYLLFKDRNNQKNILFLSIILSPDYITKINLLKEHGVTVLP